MPYPSVINLLNEDTILLNLVLCTKALLFVIKICISLFFLTVYQIKTQLDKFSSYALHTSAVLFGIMNCIILHVSGCFLNGYLVGKMLNCNNLYLSMHRV